ncbi:DUF676-domain-containing protein [Hyaloscypha variabilis F]|uniref:DUF676-domain-containing protein n=1 Tax=Hyaloscypha variabilis (strain UAMH 11265 / GT02V1 / F) TaxID=1149755 RepID=A0A2J6S7Q3_HYAVF|nr:DUF676-domain-containing protein [Hyaloscypha variabilis F]
MLLLHQSGTLKIGEVVRYTVTYTPAHDRILPSPSHLHLRIKNTTAIALRAAFIHGPYTLYASAAPATFHPNEKFENPRAYGVPEFEPQLKAGASFTTTLNVPESVRESAGTGYGRNGREEGEDSSVSWIVEVSSQVIFSNSAAVHYEILLGRDEKSLSLGFVSGLNSVVAGSSSSSLGPGGVVSGLVSDHQQSVGAKEGRHNALVKGVFSKAIRVRVDDTASLWNSPRMPEWDETGNERRERAGDPALESVTGQEKREESRRKKQKKVHLVVLTHGLHSNLGADMLYLKESIDATAKQAKVDARERRAKRRKEEKEKAAKAGKGQQEYHDTERKDADGDSKPPAQQREEDLDEDEDEEEVIVRGFSGNAVRTERGIKYLGKRLAKYILQMTYPDQPYKPVTKKSAAEALSHALKPDPSRPPKQQEDGIPSHNHSSIIKEPYDERKLAYKITSISFIAHSLGGLIQTYAVAYIQKHSPEFFDKIKPINFIAMASPFLGLSNENPLYVKFALDFGLVGRTGQDLGLTWRPPTIARSGWGAIVGGISESAHKKIEGETPPESKPLLRILPTGPAHIVLKKFRNRTVYSNVVNDGIVPLRTSCLLFLDWQGLGRVEKARRENGLVGTMAEWGWAEITGANSGSPMRRTFSESDSEETGDNTPTRQGHGGEVPQPPPYATDDDDARSLKERPHSSRSSGGSDLPSPMGETTNNDGPLASILKFFQPSNPSLKSQSHTPKHSKIYKRSQTLSIRSSESVPTLSSPRKGKATTGDSEHEDPERLSAPPKTTFFEAAGDLLKPPLPSVEFLIDPTKRPRTIFHDRVYHPEDIPPPPLKKRPTSSLHLRRRSRSSSLSEPNALGVPHTDSSLSSKDYDDTKHTNPDKDPRDVVDGSAMKVEEKIARAYHRDISWRKVLVRLEPDAHNNMIVRRQFANAYGWPVIKHLCDTHFSDGAAATTRDDLESNAERAKGENERPDESGGETTETPKPDHDPEIHMLGESGRTDSEKREAKDSVPALNKAPKPGSGSLGKGTPGTGVSLMVASGSLAGATRGRFDRTDSDAAWSDRDWADSEVDSEDEEGGRSEGWNWTEKIVGKGAGRAVSPKGTDEREVEAFLRGKSKSPVRKDAQLESDAAAARVLSGEAAGLGLGLGALPPPMPVKGGEVKHDNGVD